MEEEIHASHFGVSQLRFLTLTDGETRIANMLSVVRDLTGGKGSNFFLFATMGAMQDQSPLSVQGISGRGGRVRLVD